MQPWFRPRAFLVSIVIGLVLCGIAGRIAGRHNGFRNFVHFTTPIQPQTFYYPTMPQLLATVAARMSPDKVLVLIGGSSIFRGAWQNIDELWSLELQRLLGPKYEIVNYGIDQALFTSFSAAALRALRARYDKVIFVTLADYRGAPAIDGDPPYRYLFWDGYYKGLFAPASAKENATISAQRKLELATADGRNEHIGEWLDALFRFRDLWQYIGYNILFTVPSETTSARPFAPRRSFIEVANPGLDAGIRDFRKDTAKLQINISRLEALTRGLVAGSDAHWRYVESTYADAFVPEWRPDILAVCLRPNPGYIARMADPLPAQFDEIARRLPRILKRLGYQTIDLGADWPADYYVDDGHIDADGGRHLAAALAPEIAAMAQRFEKRRGP